MGAAGGDETPEDDFFEEGEVAAVRGDKGGPKAGFAELLYQRHRGMLVSQGSAPIPAVPSLW